MKKCWILALLLLCLALPARGESLNEQLEDTLDGLSLDAWQQAYDAAFPSGEGLRTLVLRLARGEKTLSGEEALRALMGRLLSALSGSAWRLARLLVPAIFCGVLERLRGAFLSASLGETISAGCFLLLAGCMAKDVAVHMQLCQSSVSRMADLMQALFPQLLTLLAAVGGTAGAAFFQPTIVAACGTMTALVRSVTLPLSLSSAVATILRHLSPRIPVHRLCILFRSLANWTLGVGFTVFISVSALQSLGAAAADGVTLRTAKYAVDNLVPVVGGMFADTMDTLVGASLLIKNALGFTGLMLLLATAAGPMLQTLAAVMLYRAAAALLEPVADSRVSACMQEFSDTLMQLFVVQLTVGAMFLLLIAELLVVGNLTVMLR